MMKTMSKLAIGFSVLGMAALSSSAQATGIFNEFTVTEGSVPGTPTNTIVADKGSGAYSEMLTLTNVGTFSAAAYADFNAYLADDGATPVGSYLDNFGGTDGYDMYALFYATGTVGLTTITGQTGEFYLYIDPLQNTTKTLPAAGSGTVTVANNVDDYLIAWTTVLQSGAGIPGTPGAFDFWFKDLQLTTVDQNGGTAGVQAGNLYFTDPNPFHVVVQVNGDFDNLGAVPGPGNYRVTGDVSFVFPVPEPTSLALVGLGLVGMGIGGRRRTKS